MEDIDYTRIQEAYGGKFVAIRKNEVIASADTHGELFRELKEKNLDSEDVVFEYIRPKGMVCVYWISAPRGQDRVWRPARSYY
jgi:hypothetical protein